jgi:hypothetical protein
LHYFFIFFEIIDLNGSYFISNLLAIHNCLVVFDRGVFDSLRGAIHQILCGKSSFTFIKNLDQFSFSFFLLLFPQLLVVFFNIKIGIIIYKTLSMKMRETLFKQK